MAKRTPAGDAPRWTPYGQQKPEVHGYLLQRRGAYELRWKVLNRGEVAEQRNDIRGQIISSGQSGVLNERTTFRGAHAVECYVLQDGVVVARDRIDVPIWNTSEASEGVS